MLAQMVIDGSLVVARRSAAVPNPRVSQPLDQLISPVADSMLDSLLQVTMAEQEFGSQQNHQIRRYHRCHLQMG